MRKLARLLSTAALSIAGLASTAQAEEGGLLRVVAANVQSDAGTIIVWVYDNPDTWLSDRYRTQKAVKVAGNRKNGEVTIELRLPAGDYALSIFQDVNDDTKLERNFIGLPKEPAGLSNNLRPKLGPPRYKDALFKVGGDPVEQKIALN